jgi:hypothetical protein
MKVKKPNLSPPDILGSGERASDEEIFITTLKRWRQRLAYCSIFAAVPAFLGSHTSEARSDEPKKTKLSVAGQDVRRPEKLNMIGGSSALLKRQSKFLLPHQRGNFSMFAALAGNDDCPGRQIPGGSYTAVSAYTDAGDTTGANNTIGRIGYTYYYYYSFDTAGPDQIFSFTLTRLGANPQIEVTSTSATYDPLIYLLDGRNGGCPSGTNNSVDGFLSLSARSPGATEIISLTYVPLNVPLHLFIDSARNDASGSGSYTIRIQDVTIAATGCPTPNPIDCPEYFVRQHYFDFLGREPDPVGFAGWLSTLNNCAAGDTSCDRVHISGAFFQSPEFQERGYFAYRQYSVALGRKPDYSEFMPDLARVSGYLTPQQLEAAKAALLADFMARPVFVNRYNGLNNTGYVDTLLSFAGVTLPNRQALIEALNSGTKTRAQVLREIMESVEVYEKYYNESFVVMQYFGFLRRDPDALYFDWIQELNTTGNSRNMINGFVNSEEYRRRFSP